MSTNAMADSSTQQSAPTTAKESDAVVQALAKWYSACHRTAPDSPQCQAIMSLMQAVAEIGRSEGMPEGDPAAAGMPPVEGEAPMSPDMGAEGGMPPMEEDPQMAADMALAEEAGPPPTSMADAAGQTQNMMLSAAKRKQGM